MCRGANYISAEKNCFSLSGTPLAVDNEILIEIVDPVAIAVGTGQTVPNLKTAEE